MTTATVTPLAMRSSASSGLDLPTWVMAALATVPAGFTGRVEINCFGGGVSNINFLWSVKPN